MNHCVWCCRPLPTCRVCSEKPFSFLVLAICVFPIFLSVFGEIDQLSRSAPRTCSFFIYFFYYFLVHNFSNFCLYFYYFLPSGHLWVILLFLGSGSRHSKSSFQIFSFFNVYVYCHEVPLRSISLRVKYFTFILFTWIYL